MGRGAAILISRSVPVTSDSIVLTAVRVEYSYVPSPQAVRETQAVGNVQLPGFDEI